MNTHPSLDIVQNMGRRTTEILDLSLPPVGVCLLATPDQFPAGAQMLVRHRYCQALMRARHGEHVLLDGKGINCPAAAAAFGFRPLPEGLRNGKGLVGFGIVAEEETGRRMFEAMPMLEPGEITALHLFPLHEATTFPDVIVIEDAVEKLMWVSLAYLNVTGGERIESSTAVLQAICVDSTIIPYLEERLNQGYGCYGCRDATDLGMHETVLGFPGSLLAAITEHLELLAEKAIPTSRSKRAWAALNKGERREERHPALSGR
jgi:uncharacterized protein (DUF169 family)